MSDLADLLKELEQVAKDTNLKEVKKEPLEESVTSKDDVSSLFEGLEAAYTESKIEEEIKNRLSEEDEQKLNAFSGFMQSVTELTNKPDSNKSIEDLFATITPPQPQTEILPDTPIVEEIVEDIVEEPTEIEQADTIIEQIVSSLDDMNDKTDVQEQVEQISKLRDEFNNFRSLVQQQMSSTGSGEVRLEFLDDVQRSTAKVDGKFLKFDSSSGKFVGDEPSVTSLAITALDIDGGTDIGADLADADLIIVDDGAGGTNRKSTLARLKTYIGSGSGSSAADDITAGDAAVNITTSSGNITIDAAANNSDIILKGTDGGSDTTFLTIDGSAAGKATFNDEIVSGAVITSGAGLVIADNGNIGSASDTDAIAIASDGVVTMNQIPVFSAGVNVSGGTIAGTLSTAAQGNITSLGTLTALTVDNVVVNGSTIGHTDDTDLMTVADGILTVAGEVQMTTLDIGGTNVTSTAAELNLLDGSSANSVVNSKAVIYGSSGELAGTLSTAAQGNVTSLGTLTTLTVDNIIINGTNIGHTSDTDSIAIAADGVVTFSQAPVFPNGSIDLADLDIDGGTDIGAGLADTDLFIVDDGAGGTNRKTAASRIKTYIADVTLTTAAQTNITSLGTLTALTVDNVVINGATIGHTDDTDLMTVADGVLTVAGEVDAVSLDVSGDADIDGTLEADAITVNGTALASSATTDTTNASNIGSGTLAAARMAAAQTAITSIFATDLKIGEDDQTKIDFETVDEIHFYAANEHQIKLVDGALVPVTDNDIDLGTSSVEFKNAFFDGTVTSDAFAGPLTGDVTGNADTATALATARTIHGVSFDGSANIDLSEVIQDTVGSMFGSNTETGITATYQDSDGTIDLVVGTLNQDTTGNAATATALETARTIHGVSFDGSANIDLSEVIQDTVGAMFGSNTETGITATYQDIDGTIDLVVGTLNQDTTGNAATATALETARTIHGVSFDGTGNIDLTEVIQDTVGSMFGSNTETGITATYQDADGTIDLVVGTLNQDTTGNAATATALETARTIGGVSFDGSANIDLLATDIKIGEDDQTKIDFETADEIHFYAANAEQVFVSDGVFGPETDSDVDLGTNSTRFKDAYIDTVTTTGLITSGSNLVIADAGNIGSASGTNAMSISSGGVVAFSQVPTFPNDTIETADIQDNAVTLAKMAGLARGKIIVGDLNGDPSALALGSNGEVLQSDGNDLVFGSVSASVALDDVGTGDAATTLATSAGNITIDAQGDDTDIIFKGTDGGVDTTFLTLDGSDEGTASFNHDVKIETSTAYLTLRGALFQASYAMNILSFAGIVHKSTTNNTGVPMAFLSSSGGVVGSITTNNSATSFNTSSDYRLKENIVDISDGITRLKQLKPKRFNFIIDPDRTVDGFLAHEVTSVPEAINGEHNEVDSDGNPVYQGIDQSKLVPLLTAALQESVAEIESLKTEIESLKTRVTTLEG